MTYPPPGGYDPRQYQPGSQPPQQPSDPYSQGYGSQPPPPPGYGGAQPPHYEQQPPPNMTPPIGVQPGYPQGPPPGPHGVMPPPIPPPKQGGNLGIILVVVVGLVVILGVAAVLLIPPMLEDDSDEAGGGDETSEPAEESSEPEPEPSADEPSESEPSEDTGGDGEWAGWGEPVSSEDYDPNTPEGVSIEWALAADSGDTATMETLMCANPTDGLEWELDYYADTDPSNYGWVIWSMSREVDGQIETWANFTYDDGPPQEDNAGMYLTYIAVEEDGVWKLCDASYV